MTDREKQRRAEQSRRDRSRRDREGASFTIDEWCAHRRISRAMFYVLDQRGIGPKTHNAGTKRLISGEADAAWVREREAEHNTADNAA